MLRRGVVWAFPVTNDAPRGREPLKSCTGAHGLAAAGTAGVARALAILRADVEGTRECEGALRRGAGSVVGRGAGALAGWGCVGVEPSFTYHRMSWKRLVSEDKHHRRAALRSWRSIITNGFSL